jgi:predicted ester cyclase
MITSVANERIKNVRVTDDELVVTFADGRTLSVPLVWYPRLLNALAEQRNDWELIGDGEGVHWPQIDEDLSAAGLLRGVPAPAAVKRNKALVRRFVVEGWGRGNWDVIDELVAPDFVDHDLPPDQVPDRESYKRRLSEDRAAFSNVDITIEDQFAEGDKVVTRLTWRGTHDRGEFSGVAPTGKEIEATITFAHRISEGKIREAWWGESEWKLVTQRQVLAA